MYVDESGDPGMANSPTRFFALSGLVVHESSWRPFLDRIVAFRKRMNAKFGLKLREEIHAAKFINNPGVLVRIKRNDRLAILRHFADELDAFPDIRIINILADKSGKRPSYDPFSCAWQALIQRFENTIAKGNFPRSLSSAEQGMVFVDGLPQPKLTGLLRKMRHYNPIPSRFAGYRNLGISRVIEDPSFRDSAHSFAIQAADLAAFLLYQSEAPNAYIRKSGARNYIDRMGNILCRIASRNARGIVRV